MSYDSVYGSILQGCQRIIQQANLALLPAPQVHRRKKAIILKSDEALPVCLICPAAESLAGQNFRRKDFLDYPAYVVLVQEGKYLYENLDWQLHCRQRVRELLRVTSFEETSKVFDVVTYDPAPPFDLSSLDAGYDVSVQLFTYRAVEARNG